MKARIFVFLLATSSMALADTTSESSQAGHQAVTIRADDPVVLFYRGDRVIGTLSWKRGVFTFKGQADRSALIFFEEVLKHVDESCGGSK